MSKRLLAVFEAIRRGAPMIAFLADALAEAIRRGDVFCVSEAGPDSLERLARMQQARRTPRRRQ